MNKLLLTTISIAALSHLAQAELVTYNFFDGSEFALSVQADDTQSSLTLTSDINGQFVVTALSDTNGDAELAEGGGGGTSGAGVDSNGGNSADNGNVIDQRRNNGTQTYNEGIQFSFLNGLGTATDVKLVSFSVTEFALDTGGTITGTGTVDISLDGGTSIYDDLGIADGTTYNFAADTVLSAGSSMQLLAGDSSNFRLRSVTVDVIPEPATMGLVIGSAGLMLIIRRRFMI